MNKTFQAFCFLFFFAVVTSAQSTRHVVIISIDGFRPDFYKEATWPTPNLQYMKANGAYADGVRSVYPSVTYPSHTTILTGALPARHGIYFNEPFEPEGQTGRWYWEYNLIKVPTLWTAVHQAGGKSAAVSWPVTVDAPIDYNFPEVWSVDKNADRAAVVREHVFPKSLWKEIETRVTGTITAEKLNNEFLTLDENDGRIGAYLIRTYKPALTAIHLVCVDHFEHAEGRDGLMVRRSLASADYQVGQIMDAVKQAGIQDSTAIIVTGDHGFVDIHTALAPNVWLSQHGLITRNGSGREWKAIFHTASASAFLYLRKPDDKKTLDAVMAVLAQLPESKKKLFRIVPQAELSKIGADPNAVLALAPVQGISMSAAIDGADVRPAHGGNHGFYPDFKEIQTGFIGYGPAFRKGTVVPVMGLEDIAPLVAELLHLDFKAPDGTLYPGLLAPVKK